MAKGKGSAPADDEADAVLPDDTDEVELDDADEADSRSRGRKSDAKSDRNADKKTRPAGRRGNPVSFLLRFVREVVAELRKVIWPTRKELITYTAVVVVFLIVMTGLVALLDLGFARLALIVFGGTAGTGTTGS
ncbi:preprotein translocase subunit SecE [Fodinicola acaciae]|uniref:preprotein translocase subunit SecE n=1 Tax=Fodinicola acaciae TaxID=2681555 RepID=UPI001C9E478B|nr:preprotein translocase subunit SecE [Fodinicola acaciae]